MQISCKVVERKVIKKLKLSRRSFPMNIPKFPKRCVSGTLKGDASLCVSTTTGKFRLLKYISYVNNLQQNQSNKES